MQSDWIQVTIAGTVLFVAGLLWSARYALRDLASPHTYDGAVIIGGAVTLVGALLAMIGMLIRQRGR